MRRLGIVARKRYSLFKYHLKMKQELGFYDPSQESKMIEKDLRSLNLFDFSSGKMADFHLLDDYSDASQYGGESQSEIMLIEDEDNPGMQTCK